MSHSSTEAEVISMETALRTEGLSFATLFDLIHEVFQAEIKNPGGDDSKIQRAETGDEKEIIDLCQSMEEIQFSKLSLQPGLWNEQDDSEDESSQSALSALEIGESQSFIDSTLNDPVVQDLWYILLSMREETSEEFSTTDSKIRFVVFEDNEAVIKILKKGRSPLLRHVHRTHRINLDWLFEIFRSDESIRLGYMPTKLQLGDAFTKGSFNSKTWSDLMKLLQIVHLEDSKAAAVCRSISRRRGRKNWTLM